MAAERRPLPEVDRRFPRELHLRTPEEFARAFARRCKAANGVLLVFGFPNDLGVTRLGLSVSRKVGGAVVRNRHKRLLREAFRLSRSELPPGLDLVVIPLAPEKGTLALYRTGLVKLARQLARRLAESPPRGAS